MRILEWLLFFTAVYCKNVRCARVGFWIDDKRAVRYVSLDAEEDVQLFRCTKAKKNRVDEEGCL